MTTKINSIRISLGILGFSLLLFNPACQQKERELRKEEEKLEQEIIMALVSLDSLYIVEHWQFMELLSSPEIEESSILSKSIDYQIAFQKRPDTINPDRMSARRIAKVLDYQERLFYHLGRFVTIAEKYILLDRDPQGLNTLMKIFTTKSQIETGRARYAKAVKAYNEFAARSEVKELLDLKEMPALSNTKADQSLEKIYERKPEVVRPVNDFAHILEEDEVAALEYKLIGYYDSSSIQIVIVTLNDLMGEDIQQVAMDIGNRWDVGQAKEDNGIVVLIKPKTKEAKGEVFIATGYGVEGCIPDVTAKEIVDDELIPYFKTGNYYQGLDGAIDVMIQLCH